jgi:preprotein translocase subunit SecF
VGNRVSDELFRGGLLALGLSLLAMLIYIWVRFEWQFGVAAIVDPAAGHHEDRRLHGAVPGSSST